MARDYNFLKEALIEARKAYELGEVPVGCVIVVGDEVIARSYNKRINQKSATSHAEILAINEASKKLGRWILDDATIYVTLEPCLMCAGAIIQARMKRVVFGAFEEKHGAFGSLIDVNDIQGLNHRVEVTGGILEAEVKEMMKSFFQKLRNN